MMKNAIVKHTQIVAEKLVNTLNANGFVAKYVPDKQSVLCELLDLIGTEDTVGMGGSFTLNEVGILPKLEERGNTVYSHAKAENPKQAQQLRKQQLTSDVFLTSTNALTLDGQLVNVDGTGNRVAAMIFGPGKVIVVCGINKVVADVDAAKERIANYAAPINAIRLNRATPCTVTGVCQDCKSKERICNVTTIIHRPPSNTQIHVLLVGESLGY